MDMEILNKWLKNEEISEERRLKAKKAGDKEAQIAIIIDNQNYF